MSVRAASGVGVLGWSSIPAAQSLAAVLIVVKAAAVIAWVVRSSHFRLTGGKSRGTAITATMASWLAKRYGQIENRGAGQLVALSAAMLVAAGGLSVALAIAATPRRATPLVGFALLGLLTSALFAVLGSCCLAVMHEAGRMIPAHRAVGESPDAAAAAAASLTITSWLVLQTGLLLIPSLPFVLLGPTPSLLAVIAVLGAGAGLLLAFASGAALAVSALWLSAGSALGALGLEQGAADNDKAV